MTIKRAVGSKSLYGRVTLAWELLAASLVAEQDIEGLIAAMSLSGWAGAEAFRSLGSRPTVARAFDQARREAVSARTGQAVESPDEELLRILASPVGDVFVRDLSTVRSAVKRKALRAAHVLAKKSVRASIGTNRMVSRTVERAVWSLRLLPVTFSSPRAMKNSEAPTDGIKIVSVRLLALAFELESAAAVAAVLNLGQHEEGGDLAGAFDPSSAMALRGFVERLAEQARTDGAPVLLPERSGVASTAYELVSQWLVAAGVDVVKAGLPACVLDVIPPVDSLKSKTGQWLVLPGYGAAPLIKSESLAFGLVRARRVQSRKPREVAQQSFG